MKAFIVLCMLLSSVFAIPLEVRDAQFDLPNVVAAREAEAEPQFKLPTITLPPIGLPTGLPGMPTTTAKLVTTTAKASSTVVKASSTISKPSGTVSAASASATVKARKFKKRQFNLPSGLPAFTIPTFALPTGIALPTGLFKA